MKKIILESMLFTTCWTCLNTWTGVFDTLENQSPSRADTDKRPKNDGHFLIFIKAGISTKKTVSTSVLDSIVVPHNAHNLTLKFVLHSQR